MRVPDGSGNGGSGGGQTAGASKGGVQPAGQSVGTAALPGAVAEPAAVAGGQRGKSPPRRPMCKNGVDCQRKSECPYWHPSPGGGGKGKASNLMADGWFMGVVPNASAPEVHSMIAASAPALSKSPVPQSVRALRWGPAQTKVVECAPEGEEALECGELIQHDHVGSNQRPRASSALRGQPPQVFPPFLELEERLLTKRQTSRLYYWSIDIAARHSVLSGSA